MATQAEIRERITHQVVEALKRGTPPWKKGWSNLDNTGLPANISGRSYSGINILALQSVALERGSDSRFWATYRGWQGIGGQVHRGERGVKVVYYRPYTKTVVKKSGEEVEEEFLLLREFTVFNAQQIDGAVAERFLAKPKVGTPFVDYQPAEEAIAATGAVIRYGGNRVYYDPQADYIRLPLKQSFVSEAEFYSTCLHELVHFSGHPTRLNRLDQNARFGDAAYAFEELVAEMGGCFACVQLGVPQSEDRSNFEAYLGHWIRVLQNDHSAIFRAPSQASKAVDYLLSFSRKAEVAGAAEDAEASDEHQPLVAGSVLA